MVDLQGLVTLVSQTVTTPGAERPEEMLEMFRLYDPEGRGVIAADDLRHVLTTVGEKLTDEEVDTLIRSTGCMEKGSVNYHSEL